MHQAIEVGLEEIGGGKGPRFIQHKAVVNRGLDRFAGDIETQSA
jgi:hypothetical protein